ncbi:MAG: DUF6378 domain-containing protein [Acidimicrobiales bacterium]
MRREKILADAEALINGERQQDYGSAIENLTDIALGWNVIVRRALSRDGSIQAAHVALMMDWVKTSRLLKTLDHEDSWVDKAAYTALGAELSVLEDKKDD